jgi:hypothetical protein
VRCSLRCGLCLPLPPMSLIAEEGVDEGRLKYVFVSPESRLLDGGWLNALAGGVKTPSLRLSLSASASRGRIPRAVLSSSSSSALERSSFDEERTGSDSEDDSEYSS